MQYVISTLAFMCLGAWLAFLFRWWFRHLTALAADFDVPRRRRRAAARYPFVMLGVVVPMGTVLLGVIRETSVNIVYITVALLVSVAPGLIWWLSRMPALKELGYGR
jgi:undecaprenyl pyrophosphate phosphatase UppP